MIRFELPSIQPTLNQTLRRNRWRQGKPRTALAWEIKIAIAGQIPREPLKRVRIVIERHSVGEPDEDGLPAAHKTLLDILQPLSKRHPAGLGVIANDNKDCIIDQQHKAVRVHHRTEQKTVVTIEEV